MEEEDNEITSREEQEEALVALIEHRTREVNNLRHRLAYTKNQLDDAEKRLKDSESKLARLRGQTTKKITNSDDDNGTVAVKKERRSNSPIDRNERSYKSNKQSKTELVIPAVTPKISRSSGKGSVSEVAVSSVHTSSVSGGKSDKSKIDQQNVEGKDKGTKRKFEQKEHQELIPLIRKSSSKNLVHCQSSNHISSQHKRKLRSIALCPANDQLFATSALDGLVNFWKVQAKGSSASLLNSTDCASQKQRRWPEDIAWHPEGNRLFSVYTADGGDSQISVTNWNKIKGVERVTFLEDKPHVKGIINGIVFMPWEDTCFVTGGSDHAVVLWREQDDEDKWKPRPLHRNLHSSAVMGVAGMQQKQIVLSAGADRRIFGFDVGAGRAEFTHQIDSKCMSVVPNPVDFNLFMVQTGTHEKQLRLFDIRLRRTELHAFGWKQESSESQSALINQAWSPDGLYITSGSANISRCFLMAQDTVIVSSGAESPQRRQGLLRDQVQIVKRKDGSERYEIVPIQDSLSFEKGFFIVIRACQLLAQNNDGIILVGVAGPSGAGKTVFTDKVFSFMPSIAVITMDNYNDSSRIIDGNFDDPRLTDYDTLLKNIQDLKSGKPAQVPIYDFKSSSRIGYRTIEVPSSRIVIIEGIYALSEKLRPLLDLRVSVTGGVHFDLVKRVLRDIQRAGQEPEEIIHQISETVYPMYKAFIEPDLQTAHIKIINKFNPFTGFQNPTYILKSAKVVTVDQIKAVIAAEHTETKEETYDIYLLPPGEDPEACQSYLRMRNRDGKYNLMFEEWVTDSPFIISPRITFEVSVRLLGGLMALGYTIAAILKRSSHVFHDDKVSIKTDWLEQLNRQYVQVQGKDRNYIKFVAEKLGLDGSYVPRTYIEQIQLEKLVNDVMTLPEDLKTKLSIEDDSVSSPKEALSRASADRRMKYLNRGVTQSYSNRRDKVLPNLTKLAINNRSFNGRALESPAPIANQGVIIQLSDQISTLNERMDEFTSRIEELNSKFDVKKVSSSQQNLALQADPCNGSGPTSLFVTGLSNGSLTGSMLANSTSSSHLVRESPLMEEVLLVARGQRQIMHQLDTLSNLMQEYFGERSRMGRTDQAGGMREVESVAIPLVLTLAIGAVGVFLFKGLTSNK